MSENIHIYNNLSKKRCILNDNKKNFGYGNLLSIVSLFYTIILANKLPHYSNLFKQLLQMTVCSQALK